MMQVDEENEFQNEEPIANDVSQDELASNPRNPRKSRFKVNKSDPRAPEPTAEPTPIIKTTASKDEIDRIIKEAVAEHYQATEKLTKSDVQTIVKDELAALEFPQAPKLDEIRELVESAVVKIPSHSSLSHEQVRSIFAQELDKLDFSNPDAASKSEIETLKKSLEDAKSDIRTIKGVGKTQLALGLTAAVAGIGTVAYAQLHPNGSKNRNKEPSLRASDNGWVAGAATGLGAGILGFGALHIASQHIKPIR